MFYLVQKFEPSSSMRQMGWMSFEGFARYSKKYITPTKSCCSHILKDLKMLNQYRLTHTTFKDTH